MGFKNKITIYRKLNNPNINVINFIKQAIAKYCNTTIENIGFKDISTGFDFVWDRDLNGSIRITISNLGGTHIIIESENSWDAVELYNVLINAYASEEDNS